MSNEKEIQKDQVQKEEKKEDRKNYMDYNITYSNYIM